MILFVEIASCPKERTRRIIDKQDNSDDNDVQINAQEL